MAMFWIFSELWNVLCELGIRLPHLVCVWTSWKFCDLVYE